MILWAVLAAMAALAAGLIAWPLLSGGRRPVARASHEMEVYRDQLDEVERDLARGAISSDQAAAARAEIGRRILALNAEPDAERNGDGDTGADSAPAGTTPRRSPAAALAAGLAVPAIAALMYLAYGSPGLPGLPAAERQIAETGAEDAKIREQVASLAKALEQDPDDLARWIALGDALSALRRHDKAAVAYRQAMRLAPESGALASRYGEALTFTDNGQVPPDARAAFAEAVRRDPDEPRARFYLGLADRQAGELRKALDRWLALEASSPPDAPWLRFLRPRIEALAGEIGLDEASLADARKQAAADAPASPPGPTREQMEAAQDMSPEDRQEMIRGMVDRLAARLEDNPEDAEGWMRLGRARRVLGEHEAAQAAYGKAAGLRPDDVGALSAWADAIVAAAEPGAPDPAELRPVVERILEKAPKHPRALWLAGALALSAGEPAAARTHWTALLDQLDPDSPQYARLRQQLEALPPEQGRKRP